MPLVIQAISIAMWLNRRLVSDDQVVVSECESARSAPQSASRVDPSSALHLTRL
jgi:hypothetical protein